LELDKEFDKLHPKIPEDIFLPDQEDEEDETVKEDPTLPEADDYTHKSCNKYLTVVNM
jgi:hypothetical protein